MLTTYSKRILLCILLFLFIFFPSKVTAVSVSISNFPSVVTDEQFAITASVSGAAIGQNYLKVDLYKEGKSDFFGETFNGIDWYSGNDTKQYFPITIDSSKTATATVNVRTGSPNSAEYDGPGFYKMRIRRYTSGGGYTSSEANSSAVTISINIPVSSRAPTETISETGNNVTSTTPTKVATLTPTRQIESITTSKSEEKIKNDVLGDITFSSSFTPSPTKTTVKILGDKDNKKAFLFILIGVITFIFCAILAFRFKLKDIFSNG